MRRAALVASTLFVVALGLQPATARANSFHVTCASSHVQWDDPIVFPGQPGRSHRHEFFGATSADASSTTRSLTRSRTTCADQGDTASYWAPSIEVDRRWHRGELVAYYQRAGKDRAAALPIGLRMIAGSMRATQPQPMSVTSFQCRGVARGVRSSRQSRTVPACRRGQLLSGWVRFPDCWDGRHLDSADHRSHMAYAAGGTCPSTHPVAVMKLVVRITWRTRPTAGSTVTFGGGMVPSTGFHADFWNAWHRPVLQQLRWDCIEVARPCGAIGVRRWRAHGRPPVHESQATAMPTNMQM